MTTIDFAPPGLRGDWRARFRLGRYWRRLGGRLLPVRARRAGPHRAARTSGAAGAAGPTGLVAGVALRCGIDGLQLGQRAAQVAHLDLIGRAGLAGIALEPGALEILHLPPPGRSQLPFRFADRCAEEPGGRRPRSRS
ncbi:MAG: hypothetical protein U0Z44_08855 [Kouleothrix sp.]